MSTNATSAETGAGLSVTTDVLTETFIPAEPPATRRQTQLRRQLLSADIIAGSVTGAIAALAAGLTLDKVPVVALAVGLAWPVLAYVCGLYALDDLRAWASGVGDAPRLAVTSLLISWPVFGLLDALDAGHAVVGALTATPPPSRARVRGAPTRVARVVRPANRSRPRRVACARAHSPSRVGLATAILFAAQLAENLALKAIVAERAA